MIWIRARSIFAGQEQDISRRAPSNQTAANIAAIALANMTGLSVSNCSVARLGCRAVPLIPIQPVMQGEDNVDRNFVS